MILPAVSGKEPFASYSEVPITHQYPSVLEAVIVLPVKVNSQFVSSVTLRTDTGINALILVSVISRGPVTFSPARTP